MAADAANELTNVTYADIADIDAKLEDIDTAVTAFTSYLSQSTYEQRAKVAEGIPHFWALVFEQAPPDVDQYVQPSDSAVLAVALKNIKVERFEYDPNPAAFSKIASGANKAGPLDVSALGEPRSFKLIFEFDSNDWFSNTTLEKKFWFRRARDGWAGRVSEPVKIDWKSGKDLTEGLTDAAHKLWQKQKAAGLLDGDGGDSSKANTNKAKELAEYKALVEKVENTPEGSQSFFNFFGFRGRWVSEAEHKIATKEYAEELKKTSAQRAAEQDKKEKEAEAKGEDDDDEMDEDLALSEAAAEIFFDGEDLALAISEDIWPNATKYFMDAQEDDEELSEGDFDDSDLNAMDEDDDEDVDMEDAPKPSKGKGSKK